MDGRAAELKKKMDRLLKETAEVAAQLQALEQGPGVPHYSQIEGEAHRVGRELSCRIQTRRMGEVTSHAAQQAECPSCGQTCEVRTERRRLSSIDGATQVLEPKGFCRRCRRSFFPSA